MGEAISRMGKQGSGGPDYALEMKQVFPIPKRKRSKFSLDYKTRYMQ
jgi:hypothetical protein